MATFCRLAVKAVPNAPKNAVTGWVGDALKIKVHAPALDGRANEELCEFIAEALNLPKRNVSVFQGEKSRQKVLQIDGLTIEEVKQKLGE